MDRWRPDDGIALNIPDADIAMYGAIARSDESVVPAEQGTRDDQRCRVRRPGRESN
ncbi:hypothetical protein ACH347_24375 [Saccharopolyspora sp. 5N102]|uniref:hypothetical protein n=1 Tax=Saccharopolyspora sp. 5N102 TaxID=3375155 RepID=UPI00379F4367